VFSQLLVFFWQQDKPTEEQTRCNDRNQGGKYAPYPARVELPKAERTFVQATHDDAGYQESRYNEEYIYANKSTLKKVWKPVKQNNRTDRQGAESVDIRTVFCMC
jgi:hypothetical protein